MLKNLIILCILDSMFLIADSLELWLGSFWLVAASDADLTWIKVRLARNLKAGCFHEESVLIGMWMDTNFDPCMYTVSTLAHYFKDRHTDMGPRHFQGQAKLSVCRRHFQSTGYSLLVSYWGCFWDIYPRIFDIFMCLLIWRRGARNHQNIACLQMHM